MIALARIRLALVRSSYLHILRPRVQTRFSHSSSKRPRRWVATSIALSPTLLAAYILTQTPDPQDRARPLEERSTPSLLRSYLVYSLCSWPRLVEVSPRIIDWALQTKLPGVSWLAERFVVATFFNQVSSAVDEYKCSFRLTFSLPSLFSLPEERLSRRLDPSSNLLQLATSLPCLPIASKPTRAPLPVFRKVKRRWRIAPAATPTDSIKTCATRLSEPLTLLQR